MTIALTLLLSNTATAAPNDWSDCEAVGSPRRLAACTAVLNQKSTPKSRRTLAYCYRGNAHNDRKSEDRALADYAEAMKLNRKLPQPYIGRGVVFAQRGELDKAIADYSVAVSIDGANDLAFFNRGIAYAKQGKLELAIADYSAALRLDKKNSNAYAARASVYLDKQDFAQALSDATNALAIDAANRSALYVAGSHTTKLTNMIARLRTTRPV